MCLSPITLKANNINGFRSIQVPCGHCPECLKNKQNEWLVRLYHQFRETPKAVFFTLTYNEASVPTVFSEDTGEAFHSVCKRHVQNCFKRFRRYLDKHYEKDSRPNFKYFITSEYGPRTKRPHYHGIIFGLSRDEFHPFLYDWSQRYGFVNSSDIQLSDSSHQKSARYVSKYCTKGVFENPLVALGLVEPTFHLISKGIGLIYVNQSRNFHLAHDTVFYKPSVHYSDDYLDCVLSRMRCILPNTSQSPSSPQDFFSYKMPRYYKDKIFDRKKHLFLQAALARRLHKVLDDVYLQQCSELSTEWNISFDQAVSCLALRTLQDTRTRNDEAHKALASFFDRSKL